MSERQRANTTFPVRPLPKRSNVPNQTTVNNPLAFFGPFPEGTWLVVNIDVDCRVVASPDAPAPNQAALAAPAAGQPAASTKLQAGVHDFTMPKGCQYVWVSTSTQPPPAGHEISCWPADLGDVEGCG